MSTHEDQLKKRREEKTREISEVEEDSGIGEVEEDREISEVAEDTRVDLGRRGLIKRGRRTGDKRGKEK